MNKTKSTFLFILMFTAVAFASQSQAFAQEPWSEKQLIEPSELAAKITNENVKSPFIISVSPGGAHGIRPGKGIKGSHDFGAADEPQNLEKLKVSLQKLPKDREIVVYCGCCPFNVCPNIRPAFSLLNEMGFTNHKLLNLEKNIRVDWLNKGYPMN
jgi:thiosulfate/3-mercaptopyruvate sulfurtransferase